MFFPHPDGAYVVLRPGGELHDELGPGLLLRVVERPEAADDPDVVLGRELLLLVRAAAAAAAAAALHGGGLIQGDDDLKFNGFSFKKTIKGSKRLGGSL